MSTATIGKQIDALWKLREDKREIESKLKALEEKIKAQTDQLMVALDAGGMAKATGSKASVSIAEAIVPQVVDWDKYYEYIHKKKAYYLLERRPAAAAWREAVDANKGKPLPGTEAFTRRTLSIRTV